MEKPHIHISNIKNILRYSPKTGKFSWVGGKYQPRYKEAGYINGYGYRIIMIAGRNYSASRLAWAYTHGRWPKEQIDHINHDRSDNRLCNLREVTNQENQMNRSFTGNSSGFRGVYWDTDRKKWAPKIKINQRIINLGRFDDIEEAISIRLTAECEYGFHYNHGLTK